MTGPVAPDPLCTETHEADVTCLECRRLTTARLQGPVKVSAPRHAPLCWCPWCEPPFGSIQGSVQ